MDPPSPPQAAASAVDVAVVGAGVVGLAAALAMRRGSARAPSVVLLDPALRAEQRGPSLRAVAVAADVRRFLDRLGVWRVIAGEAQPVLAMELTDTRVGAVPPPVFLTFEGEAEAPPFAHMVLQDALRGALLAACREASVLLRPAGVRGVAQRTAAAVLETDDGPLAARLVVAADGGRSVLRELAGIGAVGWDYGQSGIVATVAHAEPHGGRAVQHFLPGGPLALLPLRAADGSERRTSLVWTERTLEADRLAGLSDAGFLAALADRCGPTLGAMRLEDRPIAIPLRLRLARRLVEGRMALVGDAARIIHPLAGQGLNLGLRDAEAIAAIAAEALALGLDPGASHGLARYQRERRPAGAAMAAATDGLNRLFSNDAPPLRALRDIGLGLVARAPALKRLFVRQAAGEL